MNKTMTYKGYAAKIEYRAEEECLVGCISDMSQMITFRGASVNEIRQNALKRNTIFGLFVWLSVAILSEAQAATINISNNCNQDVTVSAYSIREASAGYLLAEQITLLSASA